MKRTRRSAWSPPTSENLSETCTAVIAIAKSATGTTRVAWYFQLIKDWSNALDTRIPCGLPAVAEEAMPSFHRRLVCVAADSLLIDARRPPV